MDKSKSVVLDNIVRLYCKYSKSNLTSFEATRINNQVDRNIPYGAIINCWLYRNKTLKGVFNSTHENAPRTLFFENENMDAYSKSITPHRHSNIELGVILSGKLTLNISHQNVIFNEEEIYIIGRDNLHKELLDNNDCTVIFLSLSNDFFNKNNFMKDATTESQKFMKEVILEHNSRCSYVRFTPKRKQTSIASTLCSLLNEIYTRNSGFEIITKGYIERLLNSLSLEYKISLSRNEHTKHSQKLFEDICLYITSNIDSATETLVSNTFYYSTHYINKLVHEHTGRSFHKLLQAIKLEKAKLLLSTTDNNIDDIARNTGHSNLTCFYRKFKELLGCTPNEYREKTNHG